MLRRAILTGGVLFALSSCLAVEAPTTSTASVETTGPTSSTTTTAPSTTTTSSPSVTPTAQMSEPLMPPVPPCLTADPTFGIAGIIDRYAPSGSDSALLATIEWQIWEGCQRFLFSMASTEGAPTLVPPSVALLSVQGRSVLRLQLGPEIETSAIAYQLVESTLVDRLYVVRSPNGSLMVDFHLNRPVAARLIPSSAPAILTVDLRPDGETFSTPPVIATRAVVFLPTDDSAQYPFTVSGYLQPGIEEAVATLTDSDDQVAESRFPLAGADDAWSSFATVFPEGSLGWATLDIEDARARLFFGQ